MHLIVMLVGGPVLVVMFFSVTVMLPADLVMEGLADAMPGVVVAGILLFLAIRGGRPAARFSRHPGLEISSLGSGWKTEHWPAAGSVDAILS